MVVFKVIRVESWSKLLFFMLFILVLIGTVSAVSATDSVTDITVSDASVGAIALESQDLNKNSDDLNIQMLSLNNNLKDEDSILINSEDVDPNELNENVIVSNLNAVQNDITNLGFFDVQAYLAINSSKILLGDTIKLTPTIKELLGNNIVITGEVVYCLSNGVKIGNSSADGYLEYTPTATGTYGFYAYFIPDNLHIYNLWEFDITNHVYLLVVNSYDDTEVNDSDVPDDQNETVDINGTVLDDNQTVDINNTVIDDNQTEVINGDIVDKNDNSNKTIVIDDDVILPNGSSQKINVKIMIVNTTTFGEAINFIIEVSGNNSNDSTSVVNESLPINAEDVGYSNEEYNNPVVTATLVLATGILVVLWLFVFIIVI